MSYLVTWGVLVQDDELDPIQAAQKGRELSLDPKRATWKVTNLQTGDFVVVDINKERVIDPE